jgi:hypothetical protein
LRGRESRQSKIVLNQMKPVTSFIHIAVSFGAPVQPLIISQPGCLPFPRRHLSTKSPGLMETLTPEERVGQLFLITFEGPEAGPTAQNGVHELISKYHVGGVVLRSANDNFIAHDRTIPVALSLTRQLQANEYSSSQQEQTNPTTGKCSNLPSFPLYWNCSRRRGSTLRSDLKPSMTPLPSQMAIGATWNPELPVRHWPGVLGAS